MELWLGALVVLLAVAFVAYPLLRRLPGDDPPSAESDEIAGLSAQRHAVYREMLELDFDHRVGKLDDDDYRALSEACLARAAVLLAEEETQTTDISERVEREIAAMRQALNTSAAGTKAE